GLAEEVEEDAILGDEGRKGHGPQAYRPARMRATRSAARPSHRRGGSAGGLRSGCASSSGISRIRAGSSPSSVFVPSLIVTGRSVLSRSVKQGTPSAVVSSWIPPESV